jgi:hypothetical protein
MSAKALAKSLLACAGGGFSSSDRGRYWRVGMAVCVAADTFFGDEDEVVTGGEGSIAMPPETG